MSDELKNNDRDPLGLNALGRLIDEAKSDPAKITKVAEMFDRTLRRYTAMKDRYRLLKESSRQLAEETAWLRDQCDDFIMEQESLYEHSAFAQKERM
jgi:hypothetical protein